MIRSFLKIGNRTVVVTLEIVAVLALIISIAFGVFVWRISQGPLSMSFAKDYIQNALSSQQEDIKVEFDDMVFTWPELKGPFRLDLTGLRVQQGEEDSNSLSIEHASVGLSRRALLIGLVRPVSVIIREPALELVREKDGGLNLFIGDKAVKKDETSEPVDNKTENDIARIFKDMAHNRRGSFLARLREFEIQDASVAVRDHEFGLSWYLTDLDFGIRRENQGVAASLMVSLPGGAQQSASIALNMVYLKDSDAFRAAGHIQDVNPYVISRFLPVPEELGGQDLFFTGEFEAAMDTNLIPSYAKFSGSVPQGKIVLPEEYDAPIEIRNMVIDSEYKAADKMLNVSNLSGEIGGIAFKGDARATFGQDSMTMPVSLKVDTVDLAKIPPLFPKSEHDGEAYEWLAHNIESGNFSNVGLMMELSVNRVRDEATQTSEVVVDLPQLKLDFEFTEAKVKYSDTLMPAEKASGKGTLDLAAEVLEINGGTAMIGELQGSDVSVKVTDLMKAGAGFVTVKAKAKGPMASALSYIAAEPIGMNKEEIGIDAAKVKGTIEADIEVALPTIKDVPKEDVNVSVKGTLTDLNIPAVVEGLPLSGGPLALETTPGGFTVKGKAQLAGRDTTLDWHQYFVAKGNPYSMKIVASVGADHELRNHFGVNLDDYISGTMPVDVVYTNKGDGTSQVDVKGDLNPVRIYIDPFKFEKPVGMPGSITLNAYLKDDVLKELKNVEIKSKEFSVSNATIGFAPMNGKKADLASGNLPNAVIGKTQAAVTFNVENNIMNVKAKAPVFDFAPFLQEGEASKINVPRAQVKEKKQPMRIALDADKMLVANGHSANAAKAYIEMNDESEPTRIEYDAVVGKGNLLVRFKPDASGKRTFRLESSDAGAALNTFGLYENILGGTLLIYGEPKGGDMRGDLYGSMRMENFRVVKAPALASLLSLMSLTGVKQLLGNEGLAFSKLESGFEWRFREAGNLLIIKDGTTSGSSIGLTFSGVVDRGKKTTDVAGTIIPMTEINSFLSKIPLVGDILGGPGGLIAATYSMKGPTSEPKVMVNPLSVLAPGIIRRILFEGGYESKIPEDVAPGAKPEAVKKVSPPKQASRTANPKAAGN